MLLTTVVVAADKHLLPSMRVEAGALESLDQGTETYHKSLIEALPGGNGDITSVLKLNPSVQFDDTQLSSKTPGEIDPPISVLTEPFIGKIHFYWMAFPSIMIWIQLVITR
ncbi:hypothetical protein [Nitrincola sp. A-D6]|uniref:hypothetical protein n=1 Tax=Nitrincola sp. A-D6 TaxID=1545442 RepID=UPI001185F964|nr:hypothetical protein [Nitrincola sp. A-D6]